MARSSAVGARDSAYQKIRSTTAAAVSGFALRNVRHRVPLLTVPYVICLLSWATVVAFLRFVNGRQSVVWERASA